MKHWTIGKRIIANSAFLLALIVGLGLFTFRQLNNIDRFKETIVVDCLPGMATIGDINDRVSANYILTLRLMQTDDKEAKKHLASLIQTNVLVINDLTNRYEKTITLEEDRQLIATRSSQAKDERIETLDNRVRLCWTKKGVFTDSDGNVLGLLGIVRDVTERKKTEEALWEATDTLQLIVQSSPLAIVVLGCDQKVKLWSPAAERMFGWSASEVIGQPLPIVPDDEREAFQGMIDTESRGVDRQGLELRRLKRDGLLIDVSLWTASLRDTKGEVSAILGVLTDITEQKRAEEAVRANERRFRSLIENSWDGVALSKPEAMCTYVSPSVTRILGYSPDEVVGHQATEFMHPEDTAEILRSFEQVVQTPGSSNCLRHRMRHKNGSWRWMEAVTTNLLDDPNVKAVVVNFRDITERKLADEELQRAEQRYRKLFEQSPHGIVIINPDDTTFLEFNDGACRQLGYTREEFGRLSIADIEAIETPTDTCARVQQLLREGQVLFETEHRTKHGEKRNVIVNANVIELEGKKYIQSIFQDVTERKLAEQALRTGESRLREAHRLAGLGAWELDLASQTTWWSEEQYRLNGVEPGTPITQSFFLSLIHPEDRVRFDEAFNLLIAQGSIELEYRLVRPNGAVRHMYGIASVTRDGEGRPTRMCGTNQDITERKQAEQVLNEERNLLASLLTASFDHIYFKDRESRFCRVNDILTQELGVKDPLELVGKTDFDLFQEDCARRFYDVEQQVMATGRPIIGLEEQEVWLNGAATWAATTIVPMTKGNGIITGIIGISRDITDRKRAEAALVENRNRLEFLSRQLITTQENERKNLARELHDEIGQTLTAVRMLCETGTCPAGPRVLELVTELMGRVRNLSFDLRPPMLDPLGLLPALLWKLEKYSERTRIHVAFQHSGVERRFASELEVAAYRIIQEALTNVARHAGVTEATVQLWADVDTLGIQVTDRGKGFDPEAVMAAGRTGGLTGILERVELLGGEMALESTPGQGTFLTVHFPISTCSENQEGKQ